MQNSTDLLITHLKALADPVRLRLLALCVRGEVTVSELTEVTAQSQPRISQHLKQLCNAGLLERFRDGQFSYYRLSLGREQATQRRRLFALLPADEPLFERDFEALCELRASQGRTLPRQDDEDLRRLHHALIELTVAAPLGDLLDIGCGQGRILKLLGSRAQRAVGVDIDADARQLARAELLLAGIENCSLRKGDMYKLPFADGEFDTVLLDDVLATATQPVAAIKEARRILKPGGRLLLLAQAGNADLDALQKHFVTWCRSANLRLAPPRRVPTREPRWLLAVATPVSSKTEAA
ncbi:MAG: metalloregulator ArsR/SmtB family transcription factor [Gammaproteobacteria bacterium]|nr:metalloregulator ArsR/SmtB family transcription factor [Gammaproteobacteria bacterium]MDH5302822.1 metalloregulator ArsR/SmtB family transcription factor [Gammaproteobacteria bacterium]MDH5321641.1 metalloregulator ArsR/SmtB family transcription factor [Gammaproteobacteria bacterium]